MARRRKYKRRKKNALDYIVLPKIDLDPDTKRGIFIIFLLALGAVSALSLFDLAGGLGIYLAQGLGLALGWGKWVWPLILLILGFLLYNEDKYYIRGTNYLGLFLFFISSLPLMNFFIDINQWKEMAGESIGGGYLGAYLALGFSNVLGFWGGLIILIGLLFVSVMLMFDTSLAKLIGAESLFIKVFSPIKTLYSKLFKREKIADENDEVADSIDEDEDEEFEDEETAAVDDAEETADFTDEEDISFSKKEVEEEPEFIDKTDGAETLEKIKAAEEESESIWKTNNIKIDLPLDLLSNRTDKPTAGDIKNNSLIIQRTLENFGMTVEMGEVSIGPTVTQYTFRPADGVKLSRITILNNDLALALAAHPIRIEAPIPGKALVGVEVPNSAKAIVGLRESLSTPEFKNRKSNLMMAVGKDVSGRNWLYNLGQMPHLLVAGATNSGKSVCLNSIIISLLYQNNPDDLRFIMVDPKRVELPIYNGIPHLLTPVITDVSKTINALRWCLNEMDRRFEALSRRGQRNIINYNISAKEPMPYIIFIIDELADLMVTAARDIEAGVIRLAQMARAVGIHLVLATQRPSVDVITGLIKANMPARIAFSVASGVDSKTILDSLGAEKLLGQGDMLFTTAEISKPKRLQGAFVSDQEIKAIVNYIKEKSGEPDYLEGITDRQKVHGLAGVGLDGDRGDEDELLAEAREMVINMGKASASLLQRRLSIGYARAARLLDLLEDAGVVGPANGAKPRDILISQEQYEATLEQGVSGASLHSREEVEEPDEYLEASDDTPDDDVDEDKNEDKNEDDKSKDEDKHDDKDDDEDDEDDEARYFSR